MGDTTVDLAELSEYDVEVAVVPTKPSLGEELERVLINGDLGRLTADQRIQYYRYRCEELGISISSKPFDFIVLNGKLTLYANKNCAEQVRNVRGVSIFKLERDGGVETYDVTAYARDKTGREDAALGSVSIKGLAGEALSNAKMKAETKAKRRVTLSLCGLGMLDETEVETIPGAQKVADSAPTPTPPPSAIAPPEGSQGPTKRRGRPPGAKNKPVTVTDGQIVAAMLNKNELLPLDEDPQAEPVMNPNQRFIDACAKEIERLGRDLYMEALGAYGFEKIEEITDRNKQLTFYKTLQSLKPR